MSLFLIDSVIKVSILLAAAGVVTTLLRRSSAASRHLVWTVALLAALALPALSGALPRWRVPMITLASSSGTVAALSDDVSSPQMAARLFERLGNTASATAPAAETARTPMTTATVPWSTVGIVVWLGGTALLLGRLLLGLIAVKVLSRRTRSAVDARWLPLARRLAEDVGASNVTFRRSARGSMPMACGLFRASVTLPEDADAWPDERLRIVLLHELAHVKRRDCLTHVLAQVACALYWFNPLSWVAARRARAERERACDDLVLAAGTPGADYADQLLEIARVMRAGRLSSVVAGVSLAMAHRSQLEGRLMAILDPSVPRASVSRARCVAIAGCAAITLLPLASLQAWGQTPQPKPTTAAPQPAPAPAPVVSQGVVDGVRGGVRGDVRGGIQGGVRGGVEGGVRGGVRGGVQAAMQSAVQGAVQGTVQGTVQGAIQGVTQSRPVIVDEQKATAQESKGKADPKVVAALTAALKDSDKEVREAALHALVRLRDPGLFEPLTQALKDGSADVREQAAFGLGQIRDKRAVDPLMAALKDPADNVREQVVFALGQLRDPRAAEALTSALKDSHANVREQAAFALGQFRATSAVPALVVALKDSAANVREQAAFALGQIRDPRAIDALTEALKDASADVRQQAAFALGQLAR
jgi:beta-lactamase regulating signal transducer with metallopeptidase domain